MWSWRRFRRISPKNSAKWQTRKSILRLSISPISGAEDAALRSQVHTTITTRAGGFAARHPQDQGNPRTPDPTGTADSTRGMTTFRKSQNRRLELTPFACDPNCAKAWRESGPYLFGPASPCLMNHTNSTMHPMITAKTSNSHQPVLLVS